MACRSKLAVLVAASVVVTLVPSVAEASWSRPRRLESTDWDATQSASAIARDGRIVVAWRAAPAQTDPNAPRPRDVVHVRRISPTGKLGPVRTLSTQDSGDPSYLHVAVDADGDALVAWQSADTSNNENPQVWARRIAWGGARGPLVRVSSRDEAGGFPAVALAPKGGGAIMYQRDRNDWTLFRFSRASRVRRPVQVGEAIPYGARVVATRTGDFVTATRDREGNLRGYRLRPDNTVVTRGISKATSSYGDLSGLDVDRSGTAWVTYEGSARPTGGKVAEFVRPWFTGGRLGRARRVTPLTHILLAASSTTSWKGGTLVAWSRQVDASKGYVDGYARMLRRDGSLGAVRRLGPMPPIDPQSSSYLYLQSPVAALDDAGDGVAVWRSEPDWGHGIAWGRRVRRNGSVGPKVRLLDDAGPAGVLVAPGGRARVLLEGIGARLWVRSGP